MSLLRPTSSIYLPTIRIGRTFSTSIHSYLHLGSYHLGNRVFSLILKVKTTQLNEDDEYSMVDLIITQVMAHVHLIRFEQWLTCMLTSKYDSSGHMVYHIRQ